MQQVKISLPEETLAAIDQERDLVPLSAYLRHLIELGRQAKREGKTADRQPPTEIADRTEGFRRATQGRKR